MKNLHFCTPELLRQIKDVEQNVFVTYRTGFVPSFYEGDIINLNERDKQGKDTLLLIGKIGRIKPVKFKQIPSVCSFMEEVERYGRRFKADHWFFEIVIYKLGVYKEA